MNIIARELKRKLEAEAGQSALIGVVGLGYVGMPLALEFARAGVRVIGYDVDPKRVAEVDARLFVHRRHQGRGARPRGGCGSPARVASRRFDRGMRHRSRFRRAEPRFRQPKDPDMRYIVSATRNEMAKAGREGQLHRPRKHDLSRVRRRKS
jgi:UDP-N-acetyl-D-glucosamine dehydrogenase